MFTTLKRGGGPTYLTTDQVTEASKLFNTIKYYVKFFRDKQQTE